MLGLLGSLAAAGLAGAGPDDAIEVCGKKFGPAATEVDCSWRLRKTDLGPLTRLPALRKLRLSGSTSDPPPDLEVLGRLTRLEELSLWGVSVENADWLASLKRLRALVLRETRLTHAGPLAGLVDLESLELSRSPIAELGPLTGLRKLRRLELEGCPVRDLRPLADLGQLEELILSDIPAHDLSPLRALGALRTLELEGTQLRDLELLGGLGRLRTLDVSRTALSDLRPLRALTRLESLDVSQTGVRDLAPLADLPKLRELRVELGTDMTPLTQRADLHVAFRDPLAGRMAGRVEDGADRPLARARLRIFRSDTACFSDLASHTTREDGTFVFARLPIGRYVLRLSYATPEDFDASEDQGPDGWEIEAGRQWQVSPLYWEVDALRLHVPAPVSGRLLDARGAPLAGALVQAALRAEPAKTPGLPFHLDYQIGSRWSGRTRTGPDGRFSLQPRVLDSDARLGALELRLLAAGHAPLVRAVTLTCREALNLGDLRLAPGP